MLRVEEGHNRVSLRMLSLSPTDRDFPDPDYKKCKVHRGLYKMKSANWDPGS